MEYSAGEKHKLRIRAYLAGFFLSLSTALGAYINSSFIEQFVGETRVGLVYSAAAVISLVVSWQALRLIRRWGNRRTIIALGSANALALAGLALLGNGITTLIWPIICIGAHLVLSFLTAINLDVYLEELSTDQTTGRIRGTFLTANNLAWLASPWLASNVRESFGYSTLYWLAALALVPCLYLAINHLHDVVSRQSKHLKLIAGLALVFSPHQRNLRRILSIDFLLNFLFAVMVIYMPIYLHEYIGLTWPQIGIIFTVMLTPYVVLQIPLGHLADKWLGEKELIIGGLVLIALACFLIPLISGRSLLIWGAVLLLSRVGAATLEIMKEAYFFKQIDGRDANIVFISRNMNPLSYILAPLAASVLLLFAPLSALFTFLGIVILLGLPAALRLKDTR